MISVGKDKLRFDGRKTTVKCINFKEIPLTKVIQLNIVNVVQLHFILIYIFHTQHTSKKKKIFPLDIKNDLLSLSIPKYTVYSGINF